jgi:hypothetical protein
MQPISLKTPKAFFSKYRLKCSGILKHGNAVYLTLLLLCTIPFAVDAQDTSKTLPNGTDGLTFTLRDADSTFLKVPSDLPANEFTGKYGTFKIGLGYIGDATAYAQSNVFKQQMDSLGWIWPLLIKPAISALCSAAGYLKPKDTSVTGLPTCMTGIRKYG